MLIRMEEDESREEINKVRAVASRCSRAVKEIENDLGMIQLTGVAGLLIEVHPDPDCALCDGPQSIPTSEFPDLIAELSVVLAAQGRSMHAPSSLMDDESRFELETDRLRAMGGVLIRMIDDRVKTGLRIDRLQSKIGRSRISSVEDDRWGRKVMEIHAEA
jgi:hypothetical protein